MAEEETRVLQIQVKINKDTKNLEIVNSEINKLGTLVDGATAKTKIHNQVAGASEKEYRKLGNALGINIGSFAGVAGGAIALGEVLKDSVENAEKAAQRQRELKSTLDGLGISYDKNKNKIDENLDALQRNTKFTREEMDSAFNDTVKSQGNVAGGLKVLKIAEDAATASGKPLSDVTKQLTDALAGGSRGVIALKKEYGSMVGDAKNAQEAVENVGKALQGQRANADPLQKQMASLKETYVLITTTLGQGLIPVIGLLANIIKGILFPVFAVLAGIIGDLQIAFDGLTGAISTIIAFIQGGVRGAAAAFKQVGEDIKKDADANDAYIAKIHSAMFGDMTKAADDYSKAAIKSLALVKEKTEKIKDDGVKIEIKTDKEIQKIEDEQTKEELKQIELQKKAVESLADKYSGPLSTAIQQSMSDLVQNGKISQKELDGIFKDMENSFEQTLEKMVSDFLAKQVMFFIMNALTGGTGDIAAGLTGLLGSGAQGSFDVGGTVPSSGSYMLKKGEQVIPPGASASNGNGKGNAININFGVSALDLRQSSETQMRQTARRLAPYIDEAIRRK